jgi:hypothetical protein
MAHYALINRNLTVVEVITGIDENETQVDLDGTVVGGSSEAWESFYASRPWFKGLLCKRTSYNGNIRKRFAGIGYIYNDRLDAFIPPKPYPSWTLNEEIADWEPPVPKPDSVGYFEWNEEQQRWED